MKLKLKNLNTLKEQLIYNSMTLGDKTLRVFLTYEGNFVII